MRIVLDDPSVFSIPLGQMSNIVNPKSVIPELGCILIIAEVDGVTLRGSSGNMSLTLTVHDDLQVEQPGTCLVSYMLFQAAIASLQGKVELRDTERKLIIKPVGKSRAKREIFKADPTLLPIEPDAKGEPIKLSTRVLLSALDQTLFAMNRTGDRPDLSTAYVGESVMCGDGTRLSSYKVGVPEIGTIPAAVILPLVALIKMGDEAEFLMEGRWIGTRVGMGALLKFNRSSEPYPDSVGIVRDAFATRSAVASFKLDVAHASRILGSLLLYSEAAAKYGILYTTFSFDGKNPPKVSVAAPNTGVFEDIFKCSEMSGPEVRFLFAASSFLDVLNAASTAEVELRVFTKADPILFVDENWVVVQGTLSDSDEGDSPAEEPEQEPPPIEEEEDDF